MKATGIVRRIDDLGRVTIPQVIRDELNIKQSDPLEIYMGENSIVFKKYETQEPKIALKKFLREYANDMPAPVSKIIAAAIDLLEVDEEEEN